VCGIVGIVSNKEINAENLKAMRDTMVHRGPDGDGIYTGEGFGLAHRRLAIIDLSDAGKQPMEYLDRYVITYNGEIYNHPELRTELAEKGYKFRSHTDTEVIMAAYDYWGTDCFNKFNGMWAFCIYDRFEDRFVLSRDRFGIKPFYFWRDGDSFLFASEIKALLAYEQFGKAKPNLEYLSLYLREGANEQGPETAFEGVYKFGVSSYVVCTRQELIAGRVQEICYWKVNPNLSTEAFDQKSLQGYKSMYKELLKNAVRLRLRSDVKVGSALSGGIDSSSIVSLVSDIQAAEDRAGMQETFSSVYKASGTTSCDESKYIDQLAQHLDVHSNQIEPKEQDIPAEHAKMIYHLETPPTGTLMSSWHTFKLVGGSDVTVTLDGQGADEQLAGYDGYITNYIANQKLSAAIYECVRTGQNLRRRALKGLVVKLASLILGKDRSLQLLEKVSKTIRLQAMPLNQKLALDLRENLVTLLHYADKTSMAHSVESRMPFMDYRLVEFLFEVPSSYKFHDGWSKYLSRIAMQEKLPANILWRRDKMGWPIPEDFWFNGGKKNWLDKTVLNSPFLKKHFMKHLASYDELNMRAKLNLLNLAVWSGTFGIE
jgi:asparagine synthase (glutamine-hydrolysing)